MRNRDIAELYPNAQVSGDMVEKFQRQLDRKFDDELKVLVEKARYGMDPDTFSYLDRISAF